MEKCDASTRKMVLDFGFWLAQGEMDKAFRYLSLSVYSVMVRHLIYVSQFPFLFSCIRSIQSETVWMNLAKMCVQTGQNLGEFLLVLLRKFATQILQNMGIYYPF